jgi:hypothetical protein
MQYQIDQYNTINRFASIVQSASAERTSKKYSFIPTSRVISVLEKHGWYPCLAGEMKCRDLTRVGFQKHIVKFRNNAITMNNQDRLQPEIVLTNSHDGFASFCIQAGLYRFVCSNGLIVADSVFSSHRIRHMGYTDNAVSLAIEEICDNVPKIGNKVEDFQAIDLTKDEQGIYASAAITAKYGEDEVKTREFSQDRLLLPVRLDDNKPTLWNTFNSVQEKLIKGGKFEVKTEESRYSSYQRKTLKRARAVNSISENVRINQALWLLTEKMAELKA